MKIFMTGASGYIGGTVAKLLINAGHAVTGLARAENSAAKLRAHGIEAVRGELSAHSAVRNAARAADAVINCADAADPFVVAAIVEGLAGSGKAFLHTSGSSVVGDKAAGKFVAEDPSRRHALGAAPRENPARRGGPHRACLGRAGRAFGGALSQPHLRRGAGRQSRQHPGAEPDPPGGQERHSPLHRRGREHLVHGAYR